MIAHGNPVELRDSSPDPKVRRFLNRGGPAQEEGHVQEK